MVAPTLTRRRVLSLTAGAVIDAALPSTVEPHDWTEAAECVAMIEATACRQSWPRLWFAGRVSYGGAIQWATNVIAYYGVAGEPWEAFRRLDEALTDVDALASARSECGRAWCVLGPGTLNRQHRNAMATAAVRRNRLLDAAEARLRLRRRPR